MNISHDIFYHNGSLLGLRGDVSDSNEHSSIRVIEGGKIHDIYHCEYVIQDLRFVQEQTTKDIMITWLAWLDCQHKHSRTYLLSFDEAFNVKRVDCLHSTLVGREKNIMPTATQFDDILLLCQVSLVEGWVCIKAYDINTLSEIGPVTVIKESVSYDFYHAPETCQQKFSVTKVANNEAAIMFYNEFDLRRVYCYRTEGRAVQLGFLTNITSI